MSDQGKKELLRRGFLAFGAAAGILTAGSQAGLGAAQAPRNTRARSHPLEGLTREPIRITDLKVTLLSFPLPDNEQWYLDWIPQRYKCWKTDSIIVEVFTDAGIRGIGGATQYGGPEPVKEYLEQYIRPAILGKSPYDVELLTSGVDRRGPKVGWAGVDAALWDIIGKAKRVSACRLLAIHGAPNFRIPVYASAGEMYDGDIWPDNLIKEALKLKGRGFKFYKFRPGTYWSVSGMTMNQIHLLRLGKELHDLFHVRMEDPTARTGAQATENYARIKASLKKVKLSFGGDNMDNRFMYKEWIDRKAMDIVQPDSGVMGITEAWYVSRMAHLQGQLCAPHNWHDALLTAANATLAGSIPNLMLLEVNQTFNPLRTDLLKEPLVPKDGFLLLPDKPGLGIEIIDDAAKRFPFIPGTYDRPRPA